MPPKSNLIVFTNGCFCLFHDGHRHLLYEAAKLAGMLIVAVNSDDSVARLKGPREVDDLSSRLKNVADFVRTLGVRHVITEFQGDSPERIIELTRPDILVKGSDAPRPLPGEVFVCATGGRVHIVERLAGHSTTAILQRKRVAI